MVEDGHVRAAQSLVVIGQDIKDAQVQVHLEAQAARLGGGVPHHHKGPVGKQRGLAVFQLLRLPVHQQAHQEPAGGPHRSAGGMGQLGHHPSGAACRRRAQHSTAQVRTGEETHERGHT